MNNNLLTYSNQLSHNRINGQKFDRLIVFLISGVAFDKHLGNLSVLVSKASGTIQD